MERRNERTTKTETLVLGAVLTALVVILQFMGAFVRFGPFSISLVLVPIVIGAATCGAGMGAWLGLVFGGIVLASGDAGAFLAVNPVGTVVTVLLKGALCGLCAGLVYRWLHGRSQYAAVAVAAVVCPVVNTGIFLLGCRIFFFDTIAGWATAAGFSGAVPYMFLGLAGGNFLLELAINVILSPIIVRLLRIRKAE